MNYKYLFGVLISIPLLPIMYIQGKTIRRKIPKLPDAKEPNGLVIIDQVTKPDINLLIIGESTMAGVGVSTHQDGFAGSFALELSDLAGRSVDWTVVAESGYKAKDVSEHIVSQLDARLYDLIVVGLGGNDAFTLNTPMQWRKEIRALIKDIRNRYPRSPIAFTNMPPIQEFPAFSSLIQFVVGNLVNILGEELSKLIKEFDQVYYNDEILKFEEWKTKLNLYVDRSTFFSDGVHPSKLTYQSWGKDFARFVVDRVDL